MSHIRLFERFPELRSSTLNTVFLDLVQSSHQVAVEGISQAMKACVIAALRDQLNRPILVVTGAGSEEMALKNDLDFFLKGSVLELPAWETLPSEGIAPSPEIVGARFEALQSLAIEQIMPRVVLTTLQSTLQKVLPSAEISKSSLRIEAGERVEFEEIQKRFIEMGYKKVPQVSEKGDFAVRGGIIDVYPSQHNYPHRIEFFGDTVESIRSFDQITQKSTGPVRLLEVLPTAEESLIVSHGEAVPLFTYLPKDTIIILDDLELLEDRWASFVSLGAKSSALFLGINDFFSQIEPFQLICFTKNPLEQLSPQESRPQRGSYSDRSYGEPITFSMFSRDFSVMRWNSTFETIPEFISRECHLDGDLSVDEILPSLVSCTPQVQTCRFFVQSDVEENSLSVKLKEAGYEKPIEIDRGYLSSGFGLRDISSLYFPMTELTGRIKFRKETVRRSFSSGSSDAFELSPGDTVVHFNHGIGKFLGIESRPNIHGIVQEFFSLEYAEGSKLFVPLAQAHLMSKYIGTKEEKPNLHALGTNRWQKLREKTEKEIVGYADRLLKSQAVRVLHGGFSFSSDSDLMKQFEDEFAYIETDDQLRAIQDVKHDMCSNRAMDRLICGDVGYGKTEVAMRAAFKAVVDGKKQVALLVPTTVLAMQHFDTFSERMAPFGVRVGVLSRFKTPKEIRRTLEEASLGLIDIVVGTHRLIQKDVIFKDLGLLIIDEEQRFGVKAKEYLKILKQGVDCLTLSATPIPRTLYMSLVGARDLSTISTPPQERVPIKTIIAEPNDQLIQTALIRELNRDGQAYFIHNRVETIFDCQDRLLKLLPKARIAVAHGQMKPDEIDLVFHSFKKGDVDILVATSIVESGIDIPNANTMIIERADHFGISDLYQLRGRVGRWNRRAFAYFLIPRSRVLPEITRKRIEAIAQSGGWGGGYKVAMRDLELRGAGDILGTEQSGHVSSIGFHLYCKLLKRAVDSIQGKAPSYSADVKIESPFDAKFPELYVNDVQIRCEFYQRLGEAITLQEVDSLFDEITDRFGKLPEEALWLKSLSRIKAEAARKGISLIKIEKVSMTVEKKQGTQQIVRKVIIPKISTPQQLEKVALSLISSMKF